MRKQIFLVIPNPITAVGIEILANKWSWHLITLDAHPVLELMEKKGVKCLALPENPQIKIKRTAGQILRHAKVLKYINSQRRQGETPEILVFKPSAQVEQTCKQHGFKLLTNSRELNQKFEHKVSFYQLASRNQALKEYLLPFEIGTLEQWEFASLKRKLGSNLVVQFDRGWAGNSTFLVRTSSQWQQLARRWPKRPAKVTPLVKGLTLINNACLTPSRVIVGPLAVQLQLPSAQHHLQLPPTTGGFGVTGGRQWPAEVKSKLKREINQMTLKVGEQMATDGYKGYFGLDFLIEQTTGKWYLLECNARLTASFGFYTQLEKLAERKSLLEWHVDSFEDNLANNQSSVSRSKEAKGCQIAVRNLREKTVKIKSQWPPGVYQVEHGSLRLTKTSLDLRETGKDRWLWLPPLKERVIKPGQLIYLAESKEILSDAQGRLTEETPQVLNLINRALGLT